MRRRFAAIVYTVTIWWPSRRRAEDDRGELEGAGGRGRAGRSAPVGTASVGRARGAQVRAARDRGRGVANGRGGASSRASRTRRRRGAARRRASPRRRRRTRDAAAGARPGSRRSAGWVTTASMSAVYVPCRAADSAVAWARPPAGQTAAVPPTASAPARAPPRIRNCRRVVPPTIRPVRPRTDRVRSPGLAFAGPSRAGSAARRRSRQRAAASTTASEMRLGISCGRASATSAIDDDHGDHRRDRDVGQPREQPHLAA